MMMMMKFYAKVLILKTFTVFNEQNTSIFVRYILFAISVTKESSKSGIK